MDVSIFYTMEKPGDMIRVTTTKGEYSGILMPQDKEFLVIKLENGYNIGIDRKTIGSIEVLKKYEKKSSPLKEVAQLRELPTISVLHTGGTIASKVDYTTGGTSAKFSPDELLSLFPEVVGMANIRSRLVAKIMSENMRFAHYNLLAKEIEKEIKEGADGIIITHGTDTLHYTSAALSFMLEGLTIPVILVGSQRSSDRPSTDSAINFLSAVNFIVKTDYAGVACCMHESIDDNSCLILPGTKTRKMHSSRRDSFKAVNAEPIARVDMESNSITFFSNNYQKRSKATDVRTILFKEGIKVGLLKCHTNMYASEFLAYLGFDGLVLEITGLGQGPFVVFDDATKEHEKIANAVKELVKTGTLVAAAPQTIYGRLQMNVYSEGRKTQELGIIGNYNDMTPETTFIKLAWLLSNHKKEEAAELLLQNLRGELNNRIQDDGYLG